MTEPRSTATPQQIARETARIRAGLSERERAMRYLQARSHDGEAAALRDSIGSSTIRRRLLVADEASGQMKSL